MQVDWTDVRDEFKKWRRHDLTLPVWWRDDDASEVSDNLILLSEISSDFGVPVHLAVIPRDAKPSLQDFIAENQNITPVVHGWSHRNHQPADQRKCEFGDARNIGVQREEAAEGIRVLKRLFGDRMAPMFVPPWNNIGDAMVQELSGLGYSALSTCHARAAQEAAPGLTQINTHVDPIYWHPSKMLSHPELIVERLVRQLKNRRQGKEDNSEPFGLLTHHLVHNEDIWEFVRQFWSEMQDGPTVNWLMSPAQ